MPAGLLVPREGGCSPLLRAMEQQRCCCWDRQGARGAEPVPCPAPRRAGSTPKWLCPCSGQAGGHTEAQSLRSVQVWDIWKSSKRLQEAGADADIWQSPSGDAGRVPARRRVASGWGCSAAGGQAAGLPALQLAFRCRLRRSGKCFRIWML